MTVERGQEAAPLDLLASQRTELVGQLAAAQFALDAAIAELSRSAGEAAILADARTQLASVTSLMRQVGSASASRLAELRNEVATTASTAVALANQATSSSGNAASAGGNLTPAQRARATIEAVGRDLFDKHVLDPYLEFDSAEDEKAYRERERKRQEEYNRAMALHTPEGDRRAHQLEIAQLADAKAHGAEKAPESSRIEHQLDEAEIDLQRPSTTAKRDATMPTTHEIEKSGGQFDEVLAALKSAGVCSPSSPAPTNGHGVTCASTSASPTQIRT